MTLQSKPLQIVLVPRGTFTPIGRSGQAVFLENDLAKGGYGQSFDQAETETV